MSFQDVGSKRRPLNAGSNNIQYQQQIAPDECRNPQQSPKEVIDLSSISSTLLTFQREVGNLPSALHSQAVSGRKDWEGIRKRFDETGELSKKIQRLIRQAEEEIQLLPADSAAQTRARLVKLSRDFRRLEATFKSLELDFKGRYITQKPNTKLPQHPPAKNGDVSPERRQQQQQLIFQEADQASEEIMRQREAEVLEINQKMHQVNAIYKDLGQLVESQQDDIDQVELDMEAAALNANSGLSMIEKANTEPRRNFFKRGSKESNEGMEETQTQDSMCDWSGPLREMRDDFIKMGSRVSTVLSLGKSG